MRSRNRLLLLTLISILMIANAGASPLLNASESCGEDGCVGELPAPVAETVNERLSGGGFPFGSGEVLSSGDRVLG